MREPSADPMDWPLPCDVTVGNGTHRKGTSLRALVERMKMLHRAAFGDAPTPEQAAANLAVLQGKLGPLQAEPLTDEWIERTRLEFTDRGCLSREASRWLVRAVERAHGICTKESA